MSDPMIGIGGAPTRATTFVETSAGRKAAPVASGVLDYFPDAIVALAEVSFKGNEQHNPGKPLFWNRSKSGDEADALMRHFLQRGTIDTDGIRHSAKVAWRALALLQKEIEQAGRVSSPLPPCPYLGDGACTHFGQRTVRFLNDVLSDEDYQKLLLAEDGTAVMVRLENTPQPEPYSVTDNINPLNSNSSQIEFLPGDRVIDLDACGTIDGVTPIPYSDFTNAYPLRWEEA